MDEAEKRFYRAQHIINDKNVFWNIEFFLNRFQVTQTARLCRVTVDKDQPNHHNVIRQEKLSIQASGSNFEIILRDLQFKTVAEGDYWVGELDFTHDGLTVLKAIVLKSRENLTARYVPPYRLRNDINKLDAYDWIDRFDDLVKKMLLLEKDKDAFRSLSSIKAQAQNIDVSKYPVETEFVPVEEPVVRAQGQEEDDVSDAEAGEVVISETDGTFGIAASPGINVVLEEASAEVVTAPEQPDDHAGLTQNPD
jgi:hypothetical protein